MFRCPLRRRMSENKSLAGYPKTRNIPATRGLMTLKDTNRVPTGQNKEEHMSNLTRRNLLAGAAVAALPPLAVPRAQAAAPLAEKQNPGWYRYKVGSFEVTAVTDGANTNPLSDSYVGNAPKNDVNAALVANHLPPDKVTHAYTPVVVNTGSKLVVIDTGLGLGMYQQSKGAVGPVPHQSRRGRHRSQECRHGDHLPLPWRPHQRLARRRQQIRVPERRAAGAGRRMDVLDG